MKSFLLFLSTFFFFALPVFAEENPQPQEIYLHGDVRTKWHSCWGDIEENSFNSSATLGCDYLRDQVWGSVKMKAITHNGRASNTYLDKAYLGYKIFENEQSKVEVEVGRNKLDAMFDSKMQFNGYFNGAHFIYTFNDNEFVNVVFHGGPHVIDSENRHYGWIAEMQVRNVARKPLTLKYSFTDWNATRFDYIFAYSISQITAYYNFGKVNFYVAYLHNHKETSKNFGYYIGFHAGKIEKKGDYEVDLSFQCRKERLLSPFDRKGLKKGVEAKVTYALEENLNIEALLARLDDLDRTHLEIQAIYKW